MEEIIGDLSTPVGRLQLILLIGSIGWLLAWLYMTRPTVRAWPELNQLGRALLAVIIILCALTTFACVLFYFRLVLNGVDYPQWAAESVLYTLGVVLAVPPYVVLRQGRLILGR